MMRGRAIAGVVAALLLLSSCGGDDEPEAEPTVKQSAPTETPSTPSTTPSTTPTEKPQTLEGFAKAWLNASKEMQLTGDSTAYSAMVSPRCSTCSEYIERVETYYANGGWVKTKGSAFVDLSERRKAGGLTSFLLATEVGPTRYKQSATAPVESYPGGSQMLRVTVKQQDGTWQVVDYLNATAE
jgi:Family of unknown function (DUF6318)